MPLLAPRFLNSTNLDDISTVPSQDTSYTKYQPERYGYRRGQENLIPYVYALLFKHQRADIGSGIHWWGRTSTDPAFFPGSANQPGFDLTLGTGFTHETQNGYQINGAGMDSTILKRVNDFDKTGGYGGNWAIVPSASLDPGTFEIPVGNKTTFKAYWPDEKTTVATYYWQKSTNGGGPWTTLSFGTGPTISDFTISTLSSADVGVYRCSILTNPLYPNFDNGYMSSIKVTISEPSTGKFKATWYQDNSSYMSYSNFNEDTDNVIIRNMTWDGNQNNNFTPNSPTNNAIFIKGKNMRISKCKFINFGVGNSFFAYPGAPAGAGTGANECFVVITSALTASTSQGPTIEECEFTSPGIKNGPDTTGSHPERPGAGHIPEYTCLAFAGTGSIIKNNKFYDIKFNTNQRSPIHCVTYGGSYNTQIYGNSFVNIDGTPFYVDSYRVTGSYIRNNYISGSWVAFSVTSQTWPDSDQVANYKDIDFSNNTVILSDGPTTYNWFKGEAGNVYPSIHFAYNKTSDMVTPFKNVKSQKNKIKRGYYNGTAQNGFPANPATIGYSDILWRSPSFPGAPNFFGPDTFTSSNETLVTSFPSSSMRLTSKLNQLVSPGDFSYVVSKSPTEPLGTGTQTQVASVSASFLNPSNGSIVMTNFKNLTKNSTYYYWLKQNSNNVFHSSSQYITTSSYLGKFKTRPNGYEPYRFTASFASCMNSNTTATIFNKIKNYNPDVFFQIGDMFYWDNSQEPASTAQHESAYQNVFSSGSGYLSHGAANPNYFPNMLKNVAIDYMWDDHDYGNNNSDRTNVNKGHAALAVATMFPHVPFTAPTTPYISASVSVNFQPIYHSWKVGRTKFIFTDNRSEKDPYNPTDPADPSKIIWSSAQQSWFMNEMRDTTCPIKFWINTFPWEATNGFPYQGDDGWERYTYFREKIANFLTRFSGSIGKIIMLSGDAHMTAIDDGLYSTWYGSGSRLSPPMTIYHSAPLDQNGSIKGGPYMLSGSDILRGSSAGWLTTANNYAEAFNNLSSSYITTNNRFGCVEIDDDMTGIINIDLYSRSGTTDPTNSPAGDPGFPMVAGNYRKLRLSLDVSSYFSGSGGFISQSSSFLSVT